MLLKRHMHLEMDMIKWLAILALAMALAVLLTNKAGGAGPKCEPPAEPALLPAAIAWWATPVGENEPDAMPLHGSTELDKSRHEAISRSMRLWIILADHQNGNLEQAIAGWEQFDLPRESEVWRQIAIGAAHLGSARLDESADALEAARNLEPNNPLVHFHTGLLRLVQAQCADSRHDAVGSPKTRLITHSSPHAANNMRGHYEKAAMMEFERTIEDASHVMLTHPIISASHASLLDPLDVPPVLPVTVGDLLIAIGADRFEAKAHNVLGHLDLERELLEEAELHMDHAASGGLKIVYGYQDLGKKYEMQGLYMDAARAYGKAIKHGRSKLVPLKKMMENLHKAMIDSL